MSAQARDGSGQCCRVGVVHRAQRAAVEHVRRVAYREAAEFDWNDANTLAWSAADDAGVVLALWNERGALVSTLRASVLADSAAAERLLEYSLEGVEAPMPALVLSRAATMPDQARQGLFGLMRYAYLSALGSTPIGSVIAIVYEGGPRLGAMRAAGYDFIRPCAGWDSEAVARTQPLLAVLTRTRFEGALGSARIDVAERLALAHVETESIAAALRACCPARV
jgi:hypothetical protein